MGSEDSNAHGRGLCGRKAEEDCPEERCREPPHALEGRRRAQNVVPT